MTIQDSTDNPGTHLHRRHRLGQINEASIADSSRICKGHQQHSFISKSDDLGFNAAIGWLARDTAQRMGIEVTVSLDEADPRLDERSTTALYRMVQEALTNVVRHARASAVHVDVRERAGRLTLTVHDNGSGFAERATHKAGSFGLMGMRERVFMLGGEMRIDNPPEGGGRITVSLPVAGRGSADAREGQGA